MLIMFAQINLKYYTSTLEYFFFNTHYFSTVVVGLGFYFSYGHNILLSKLQRLIEISKSSKELTLF